VKRKLLYAVLAVLVVVAVGTVLSTVFLGNIIQAAVPTVGSAVMGVEVSLERAEFSVLRGKARLSGLSVGNPEGFDAPTLCKLDDVRVEMRPRSVLADTIVIDRIYIKAPHFTYQRGLTGSNVGVLLETLEPSEPDKKDKEAGEPASRKSEKKVIIHDLLIEEPRVKLGVTAMGSKTASIRLPSIHLTDIGKESEGASVREVLGKVFGAIGAGVTKAAGATVDVAKKAGTAVGGGVKTGAVKTGEVAGKAAKSVGQGAKAVGQGVGKALGGLKDAVTGGGEE
jgi:hypothetical protein